MSHPQHLTYYHPEGVINFGDKSTLFQPTSDSSQAHILFSKGSRVDSTTQFQVVYNASTTDINTHESKKARSLTRFVAGFNPVQLAQAVAELIHQYLLMVQITNTAVEVSSALGATDASSKRHTLNKVIPTWTTAPFNPLIIGDPTDEDVKKLGKAIHATGPTKKEDFTTKDSLMASVVDSSFNVVVVVGTRVSVPKIKQSPGIKDVWEDKLIPFVEVYTETETVGTVWKKITEQLRQQGLLVDPSYAAKPVDESVLKQKLQLLVGLLQNCSLTNANVAAALSGIRA